MQHSIVAFLRPLTVDSTRASPIADTFGRSDPTSDTRRMSSLANGFPVKPLITREVPGSGAIVPRLVNAESMCDVSAVCCKAREIQYRDRPACNA